MADHRWDEIRARPTTITTSFMRTVGLDSLGHGVHESLLRSYHVLGEAKSMLERGDSPETVRDFITWAEQGETIHAA